MGKKIAVLGLGREGRSTLNFLKSKKIKAGVLDAKLDKNYLDKLTGYEVVFRTPGVPRVHPKLLSIEKKGTVISSQIKLFFDLCPAKIIGITGTKGKTTTAFLIYNILKIKYGKRVFLAGNFGKPALEILPRLKKDSLVVLELSSFQLQDLHKGPNLAVITNITLDHMDQTKKFLPSTHQNLKEYFDAKMNIIKYQRPKDFAVIHPSLKSKTKNTGRGRKIFPNPLLADTKLRGGPRSRTFGSLRGKHNLENIALAIQVGKIFKVPEKNILKIVKNFKSIEHRLEFVKKINGIFFYNDSAATNPDAALAALKSFEEPIHPVRGREGSQRTSASNGVHLILGGSDKGLDYLGLAKYISKSKNIRTVALIGQIRNKLSKVIKDELKIKKRAIAKSHSEPKVLLLGFKNLKDAVLTLFKKADKNEVVILSPGAASFDMFSSYAERGDEFKKIVRKIGGRNGKR